MRQRRCWGADGCRYTGMLLLLAACVAGPAAAQDIYWTGEGANNHWSNPTNWLDNAGVQRVPVSDDIVRLGYEQTGAEIPVTIDDSAQNVLLDLSDVMINQIFFNPTGERVVRIDASDSQTLTVTNNSPVTMVSSAANHAYINVDIHATGFKPDLTNNSADALLVIDSAGKYRGSNADRRGSGTLEIRGLLGGSYRGFNAPLILATEGGPFVDGNWSPTDGATFLLKTDSAFGVHLRGSGRNEVMIYDSGSNDRTLRVDSSVRGGPNQVFALVASTDGSTGHLTFSIGNWYSDSLEIETYENSTVLFDRSGTMSPSANAGISGSGQVWLNTDASHTTYGIYRPMTYTGRTMLEEGVLQLYSGATYTGQVPVVTIVELGENATLDLNGVDQTIGGMTGFSGRNRDEAETFGTVTLGGAALTINAATNSSFGGVITGAGALVKAGGETFTLAAGYTNVADRLLRVADGVLAVTGVLSVEDGTFELAGGRITAGSLASTGTIWNVTLHAANEDQVLVEVTGEADITGALLNLELAGGYAPVYGTEYTLLYAGTLTGAAKDGLLFGIQDGESFLQNDQEYEIRWQAGSSQLILTAIPEPGSLLLLLLAGAGFLTLRRRRD